MVHSLWCKCARFHTDLFKIITLVVKNKQSFSSAELVTWKHYHLKRRSFSHISVSLSTVNIKSHFRLLSVQMWQPSIPRIPSFAWGPTWRPAAGCTLTWGSMLALCSGLLTANNWPALCTECSAPPTSVWRWLDSTPPGKGLVTTWSVTTTRATSWLAPASTSAVSQFVTKEHVLFSFQFNTVVTGAWTLLSPDATAVRSQGLDTLECLSKHSQIAVKEIINRENRA